jgi:hypothetical protein
MQEYTIHLNRLGVNLNGKQLMTTDLSVKNITNIMCKSGHGSACVLDYEPTQNKGYYFMDPCEKSWKNYYEFYSKGYEIEVILKCDDDIVFMDVTKFNEYIQYVKRTDYDLVFANIINNGVCAYYQQQWGLIPREVLTLEFPPDGLWGSLWESGDKASRLHQYFLENYQQFLNADLPNKEITTRFSVNFFGIRGENWRKIASCHNGDDEENLTVTLVQKGLRNVMFSNFYVSHLSFFKQDLSIDPSIIHKYDELADALTFGVSSTDV